MMRGFGVLLSAAVLLASIGCGGSSPQSSVNLDISILETEGEYLIQGTVFNDLNGNGILEQGEPGIEGVDVALAGVEGTLTDSMGMYAFAVTVARAYTVTETDPDGFLSTTPNEVAVIVSGGDVTVDFGDQAEIPTWSIYGTVYDDLNMNGMMESGEPGIEGVTLILVGVDDTVTDSLGMYAFAVTVSRAYTVVETDPEGYVSTTPNEAAAVVTEMDVRVDFGDRLIAEMTVDVKPGSDINPLNLRSRGVLPVAILGSEDLDVTSIDPASLFLNGVAPLRWSYEDVCCPDGMEMDSGMEETNCETADGYEDLTLKFSTQEIAASLGEVERGDIVTLTLTGTLMDGTPASGEETVWIVQVQK